MHTRTSVVLGLALLAATPAVMAVSTRFSNFHPLTASAGPLPVDGPEEAAPITLSSDAFSQRIGTIDGRVTADHATIRGDWLQSPGGRRDPDAGRRHRTPLLQHDGLRHERQFG